MERRIIPILGDGNCLFRSISYCLYHEEDRHRDIRLQVVRRIVTEWDSYKDFIIGDQSYRIPIQNCIEYEQLLSRDGEYAGHVELNCVSQLFSNYTFKVHRDDSQETSDYGTGNLVCHLLFSGNVDAGHYSVLEFNLTEESIVPCSKRKKSLDQCVEIEHSISRSFRRKTLTGRRESHTRTNRYITQRQFQIEYRCAVSDTIPNLPPFTIGNLCNRCSYCSALYYSCEKNTRGYFTLCCSSGKINLPQFRIPIEMEQLFTGTDEKSKNFRDNIRQYNNAMSFVSFGANIILPSGYGPYCFKILGVVHHRISSLYSENSSTRSYGQLYILDFSEANKIRMEHPSNVNLREDIVCILNQVLHQYNPYVRAYKTMHQKICEEKELALKENRPHINLVMRFYHEPREDSGRFNDPTCSEVAAVFESTDGAPPSHRHIAVYPQEGGLKKIDFDSMHCDPMCYVLVWPCGETGWHISMPNGGQRQTKIRSKVTMREYISYKLAVKGCLPPGNFNPVINAGKLTQQLIVDYYCRIEGDRLKFIRNQQSKLRVETYVGLADALHARAEHDQLRAGRIVILPSLFIGSPRNMMQNYQDAMAIVRKFGKPDIFITFTCNASWPEITNNINSYETPNNRPDIVVRVFHAKIKELLRLINEKQIFGEIQTFLYTVEFQKRGLPHIHLLLSLKSLAKLREISDIDKVVSAEIPDPNDSQLFALVSAHMIHGPCGSLNAESICMENGKCKKEFPKEFVNETKENINGYPIYRRRNNSRTITKYVKGSRVEIDNRFVVPYNPFLLIYFRAHINVEICASVHSVKYIHKYIYKGHDCANLQVTTEDGLIHHDEISTFLNTRYVGPSEAAHRIFAYAMHQQSHTVARLPVHLPNEQQVYFTNDNAAEAITRADLRNTELMAWFNLNKDSGNKSPYVYPETPNYYVWDRNHCRWKKRMKSGNIIGRMFNVAPSESERYHLRLLLLHVVGATCFKDLKTYQMVTYSTFKEAAMHRGLLIDDSEWHRCLLEASVFQMPFQLRQLFSYICVFQQPSNTLQLWDTFKNSLCEDYLRLHNCNFSYQLGLRDIEETLKLHRFSLSVLNLPVINDLPIPNMVSTNIQNINKHIYSYVVYKEVL